MSSDMKSQTVPPDVAGGTRVWSKHKVFNIFPALLESLASQKVSHKS